MATIKYWNGSAWELAIVGKQGPAGPTGPTGPAGSASLQRFRFVATGGETSLSGTDANGNTLAYTSGLEEVFLNGAALVRGQDYTATNGTSITGLTALIATDVVEILAWGVFDVANTISNTLIDAKGDILAGSAADTVSRLAVGANDTVLTADSSTATGLKWAAASAGGMTQLATGTLSGASVTLSSINQTYNDLSLRIYKPSTTSASGTIWFRINGITTASYEYTYLTSGIATVNSGTGQTSLPLYDVGTAITNSYFQLDFPGYSLVSGQTVGKAFNFFAALEASGRSEFGQCFVDTATANAPITSITIFTNAGSFDAGTYTLWGIK